MLIAFSGLDGSGKTTQSRFAESFLKERGYGCVYRHAIKDSLYYFILHRMIGKVSDSARTSMEKGLRGSGGRWRSLFLSAVKKFFLFVEVLYFNLRYRRYRGSAARNIVCDRYFYDEMIQAEYLGISGRVFSRTYKGMIPEPDVTFFLKVDPGVAFDRKKEYDRGYFMKKQKAYDSLDAFANVKKIDEGNVKAVQDIIAGGLERLFRGAARQI